MSAQESTANTSAPADLYKAEYAGSGTFRIKKPKRSARKAHQARVRNRRRARI
jgi:hypothetical protein